MATIHDVARAAGVSPATVSRSFALKHPLREKTRERVLREAARLNYRPRRPERMEPGEFRAAPAATTSIGFQYFQSNPHDMLAANAFYAPVLAGAQLEADRLGMHLMLHTTHRHKMSSALPQMVTEQAVPGMLLVGTEDADIIRQFLPFVPTIVLVDTRDPLAQNDCVVSDGFGGAVQSVDYLVRLGHRRIAFVGDRDSVGAFGHRRGGYMRAMHSAGLWIDGHLMCAIDEPDMATDMIGPVGQIISFLKNAGGDRPTAIVAANDAHALAAIHACRRLGMELPCDMSIVGFDDTDFSAHMYPALTTVRVEKEQMGRVAVRRLAKRIQEALTGEPPEMPVVMELPVSLVDRSSCAPPPKI